MTTSQSSFSTSDDIIAISDGVPQVTVKDPDSYFEISRCITFINTNDYSNIVLQFPDTMMSFSAHVLEMIKKSCNANLFILGDTSYGSCCVDEVAAAHVNAQAIIHFGHSCLSCTQSLPVLFVFGRQELEKDDFLTKIRNFVSEEVKVVLFYDVIYDHIIKEVVFEQECDVTDLVIARLKNQSIMKEEEEETDEEGTCFCFGRSFKQPHDLSNYKILYVGFECHLLTNLIYKFNRTKVYSYNPTSKQIRLENASVNRALMKRYYLIEKAKDANIVGIIMGTLGVSRYKEIVERLKKVLKHSNKKFYTFVIGKINVAKIANFMEIDIFVLVACPENSLIDSKEFYKPVLTPYEIEIACLENRPWTGDYITDFSEILPGSKTFVEIEENTNNEPRYSFITGKMCNNSNDESSNKDNGVNCTDLIKDNIGKQIEVYSADDYFTGRSWQGLQVNVGTEEVRSVEQGRSGIAMEYKNEENGDLRQQK